MEMAYQVIVLLPSVEPLGQETVTLLFSSLSCIVCSVGI